MTAASSHAEPPPPGRVRRAPHARPGRARRVGRNARVRRADRVGRRRRPGSRKSNCSRSPANNSRYDSCSTARRRSRRRSRSTTPRASRSTCRTRRSRSNRAASTSRRAVSTRSSPPKPPGARGSCSTSTTCSPIRRESKATTFSSTLGGGAGPRPRRRRHDRRTCGRRPATGHDREGRFPARQDGAGRILVQHL